MIDDIQQLGVIQISVSRSSRNVDDQLTDTILLGNVLEVEFQANLGTLAQTGERVRIFD